MPTQATHTHGLYHHHHQRRRQHLVVPNVDANRCVCVCMCAPTRHFGKFFCSRRIISERHFINARTRIFRSLRPPPVARVANMFISLQKPSKIMTLAPYSAALARLSAWISTTLEMITQKNWLINALLAAFSCALG